MMSNNNGPHWVVEIQAATYPKEEWVALRHVTGRLYRYLDEDAAKEALATLKKTQPHATFRIVHE